MEPEKTLLDVRNELTPEVQKIFDIIINRRTDCIIEYDYLQREFLNFNPLDDDEEFLMLYRLYTKGGELEAYMNIASLCFNV